MNMRVCPALQPCAPLKQGHAGRVVAVVVTHDRLAQLRRTLFCLLTSPPEVLAAVVVVDNASGDGTHAWLSRQRDRRLHVLRLGRNAGGAGGFAAGIAHARRMRNPDWVVLMDDDARPYPGTLAAFHGSALAGWDAVVGAAYLPHGGLCDMNRPSRDPFGTWRVFMRTLLRGREGFHLGVRDYAGTQPVAVDAASFVGLFLSRRAMEQGGLPDASLFVYADDMLHSLRLSRAGGRIGFFPALRFEHDTQVQGAGSTLPLWKLYYKYRNSLILYREASGRLFWPVCAVVLPVWVARVLTLRGQRRAALHLLARAVAHGLRGRTDIPHEQVQAWARGADATEMCFSRPRG